MVSSKLRNHQVVSMQRAVFAKLESANNYIISFNALFNAEDNMPADGIMKWRILL
jgi:hypothetical protein